MAEEVEINATLNPEGTVKGLLEIEESTVKAAKKVSKLTDEYEDLNQQLKKLDTGADEWEDLYKEVTKAEKALNKANKELDETTQSANAATGSISGMQQTLASLEAEISGVAVGSKEFDALSAKIRKVDGELTTATESLNGLSSEDKASRVGQLAGGLGNVAASAALIGGEESAIGEFFGGLEGAIGIMVGVQGAIEAVAATKKLLGLAAAQNAVAVAGETAAMGASTVATGAQAVATGAATTSMWALNASLLANPIFWIVAVIMAVIAAFALFSASTKTAGAEHAKLNKELEREGELIESNRKARERANSELLNEIANKEKLIQAERDLLAANESRTKAQEEQLKTLNKQLGEIDEQSLDIMGEETRKQIAENSKLMHGQVKAAQVGLTAVWDEDWGSPDFDFGSVRTYFSDVDALQGKAARLYNKANEATTEAERDEYIKRANAVETQVTKSTARIQAKLVKIKGELGGDASEEMEKVIENIAKFGERADESAGLISEYQKAIDNFNTDGMVGELEDEAAAQEEANRKREEAIDQWKDFIASQRELREELSVARMSDQERELHELDLWNKERQALVKNDADLAAELAEELEKRKIEISDKYKDIETEKEQARAAGLLEIERQLADNRALIASMRISAAAAMAEEEVNAQLEAWQKGLEESQAISDQELSNLKASLAARRDTILAAIDQESTDRKSAAERARIDEIAAATEKIAALQESGLAEAEAMTQLAELKKSILAKYNAEVADADEAAALEKRAAQKEYNDAELQAEQEQKDKLVAINQAHTDKILGSLDTISQALNESVGEFEGALGTLASAVSSGISQLGSSIQGLSEKLKEIKEKTKDGAQLSPEEVQEMKENTAAAVSAIVGAAGAVAQGIVQAIAENNAAKAEERIAIVEENAAAENAIIDRNLASGLISQEAADKQRNALQFKAEKAKFDIQKKAFDQDKKAKIAAAAISGLTGAVSAFAGAMSLGPIAGPIVGGILAAAVGTMTGLNISKIKKTRFGGTAPTAASSGAPSATPSAVNPSNFLPTGSESQNEEGSSQTGEQGLGSQGGEITVKAIVVETDVTDTQNQVSAIEDRSEFN